MNVDRDRWRRLATAVIKRRHKLGLTQEDVRASGGPSTATMRLIEGALQESYSARTFTQLDRALRWPLGTVTAVLEGAEPPFDVDETALADETGRSSSPSADLLIKEIIDALDDEAIPEDQRRYLRRGVQRAYEAWRDWIATLGQDPAAAERRQSQRQP